MEKEYTINGRVYRLVEEEKKPDRLIGWICRAEFIEDANAYITKPKAMNDDTRMIEIREGEVIVSKESIRKAWLGCIDVHGTPYTQYQMFLKLLEI
jgi:hypothetical protein